MWWWTVANRFWFQRLELKLGWSTGATAGPHAWPFAFSRWSLFFAAFTTGIVDSGTKCAGESKTRTAAGVTSRAGYWGTESSFAVGAHRTSSAPVIRAATASASASSTTAVHPSVGSAAASPHVITAARVKSIAASTTSATPASLFCENEYQTKESNVTYLKQAYVLRVLRPILGNVFAVGHLLLLTKRELLECQFSIIHEGLHLWHLWLIKRSVFYFTSIKHQINRLI